MSVDEALLEYMRRVDAGEPVDREGFLAAHPGCAEELAEYLQWSDEVEVMLGPEGAEDLLLRETADTLELEARSLSAGAGPGEAGPAPGTPFHGYLIEAELHRGRTVLFRARDEARDRAV